MGEILSMVSHVMKSSLVIFTRYIYNWLIRTVLTSINLLSVSARFSVNPLFISYSQTAILRLTKQVTNMVKNIIEIANSEKIKGWSLQDNEHDDFKIGLELASRVKGKACAFIESHRTDISSDHAKNATGHLKQRCGVDKFIGNRIRMTAWVKTDLKGDSIGRLELSAIGPWGNYCKFNGTFDNMSNRQIKGRTNWQQHDIVIRVLEGSYCLSFGIFMIGVGKMWLDDVKFEIVDESVPITGLLENPTNLNFED